MSNILYPTYYIMRDRIPFFFTLLYIYKSRLPSSLIKAWGWYFTFLSAVATGLSFGLYFMGKDMSFIAGIAWSSPSPIQWGSMIVVLTGILWSRKIPIFDSFYIAFLTAMGGGWLYEFTPMIFHDFNLLAFIKFNAVKVFFIEFQLFCLPIIAYIILTSKQYKANRYLIPAFLGMVLFYALTPTIKPLFPVYVGYYAYRWYVRLPAIIFLSVWVEGIQGEKETSSLFPKFRKYVALIPIRVQQYGLKPIAYKIIIDLALKLHIPIPPHFRWMAAHSFQTSWKRQQKATYGIEEYNRRIDLKSIEVMTKFYEVGLDFTGKTFVDLGCGTRGVLPSIKADRRIGIDPTIGKLPSFTFPNGIEYLSEKAENMSLPDNSVDVLCCNNTLNHVENPRHAIIEIYRVLKPGGLFLLEVFIEKENIAHTVEFNDESLGVLVEGLFKKIHHKFEQLIVEVDIDENYDGFLPWRWGGVFQK